MSEIVGNNSAYNLRNNENYATVARRLEIYSKSVIPSSIKVWNSLDLDTRNSQTLSAFKARLKIIFSRPQAPSYFLTGDRFLQITTQELEISVAILMPIYAITIYATIQFVNVVSVLKTLTITFSNVRCILIRGVPYLLIHVLTIL